MTIGIVDLLFYLGLQCVVAFVFYTKGRGIAYDEVASAGDVDSATLMDEVAEILRKK